MASSSTFDRPRPKWTEPPTYDPLPVLLIYLLVVVGGVVAVLDTYLPTTRTSSVVSHVTEHSSYQSVRGPGGFHDYWSSVDLVNGKNIWTRRPANNFAVGDTMDVDLSAVIGKVVRYRSHSSSSSSWFATEGMKEDYKPLPFAAILFALLLFYPGWSSDARMMLRALLLIVTVTWLITLMATGG